MVVDGLLLHDLENKNFVIMPILVNFNFAHYEDHFLCIPCLDENVKSFVNRGKSSILAAGAFAPPHPSFSIIFLYIHLQLSRSNTLNAPPHMHKILYFALLQVKFWICPCL